MKILLGKTIDFDDVIDVIDKGHKIYHIKYDDESWQYVAIEITEDIYDDMMNDYYQYVDEYYVIDPIIVNNGDYCNIPKGKYEIWKVAEIL